MNVLAIYTAEPGICVAAEGPRGSFLLAAKGRQQQAEEILPFLETAAEKAGFALQETQLVTAAEGPGSFTGLRLAYSAAKAVQFSSRCPFLPVPTFSAWAHSLQDIPDPLFCVLDAKKKRFYGQFFISGEAVSGVLDLTPEEAAGKLHEVLGTAAADSPDASAGRTVVLTAEHGKTLYTSGAFLPAWESLQNSVPEMHRRPVQFRFAPVHCGGIFSIIALSKQRFTRYTFSEADFAIGPAYIRKSDAETAYEE